MHMDIKHVFAKGTEQRAPGVGRATAGLQADTLKVNVFLLEI